MTESFSYLLFRKYFIVIDLRLYFAFIVVKSSHYTSLDSNSFMIEFNISNLFKKDPQNLIFLISKQPKNSLAMSFLID